MSIWDGLERGHLQHSSCIWGIQPFAATELSRSISYTDEPCWDCYDFTATVAHEAGHILGFEMTHPDTGDGLKGPYTVTRAAGADAFDIIYRVIPDGRKTPFMERLGAGSKVRFGGRFGTPVDPPVCAVLVSQLLALLDHPADLRPSARTAGACNCFSRSLAIARFQRHGHSTLRQRLRRTTAAEDSRFQRGWWPGLVSRSSTICLRPASTMTSGTVPEREASSEQVA